MPHYHDHFDVERDARWACYADPCLIPEFAPRPSRPAPAVPERSIAALLDQLAETEARVVTLAEAVAAHRPFCDRCRALLP